MTELAMTREVRLYGVLAKKFGRVFHLAVASPAEAVRALCAVLPGFEAHLRKHSAPGYRVFVGTENRALEHLGIGAAQDKAIRIVPVIAGAKRGLGQMILGTALIVAGVFFQQPWLVQLGLAQVIGGVSQMLSPQRMTDGPNNREENKPSYNFDGPVNTVAAGNIVPILLGRMIVGGAVFTAGLSAEDLAPAAAPAPVPAPPPLPANQPREPETYDNLWQDLNPGS